MARLYEEFKKYKFIVLAVNIQEPPSVVKHFVKKERVPFPVLLDRDGRISKTYGVRFQPDHFLINQKGELIGKAPGAKNWINKEMRNLIRLLVNPNLN